MKLLDLSEIICGLVLKGNIQPEFVPASRLTPPYDRAMEILQSGGSSVDVIDKVGLEPVRVAQDAISRVEIDTDWLALLDKAAAREELAGRLEKQTRRLRNGEDEDAGAILSALHNKQDYGTRYVTLDKIEKEECQWIPTGYPPVDIHVGGLPHAQLCIVGAPPGTGKTTLMLRTAIGFAKQGKRSLIYTFEMTAKQILYRSMQLMDISMEDRSRMLVCEDMLSVDEVYADASRIVEQDHIDFICLDFADLMVAGMEDEQSVAHIYRVFALLAKRTLRPVMLLSQLNREYVRGVPRVHNVRYSGLAEAMAGLILLLYNPSQIWADMGDDKRLPLVSGRGYIFVGKSRFGFKEGGVGAIGANWEGEVGWGDEDLGWYPLSQ